MCEETGFYSITASLANPIHPAHYQRPRVFAGWLLLDIYQSWKEFHARSKGFCLLFRLKLQDDGSWICDKPDVWAINEVRMITREEWHELIRSQQQSED